MMLLSQTPRGLGCPGRPILLGDTAPPSGNASAILWTTALAGLAVGAALLIRYDARRRHLHRYVI